MLTFDRIEPDCANYEFAGIPVCRFGRMVGGIEDHLIWYYLTHKHSTSGMLTICRYMVRHGPRGWRDYAMYSCQERMTS
jgi:hypothetical protein